MVVPRRAFVACGMVLLAALAACGGGPEEARVAAVRGETGLIVFPTPRNLRIPPLVDQHGSTFGAEALRGKWSFLFLGYASCPDICPVTMATLRDAERALDDPRFQAVLVTADPKRDTPDTLRTYVEVFSPRFLGVTGAEGPLRAFGLELAAHFSKMAPADGAPADRYLVDHSGHAAIVDPSGRFAAILKNPRRSENVVQAFRALAGTR